MKLKDRAGIARDLAKHKDVLAYTPDKVDPAGAGTMDNLMEELSGNGFRPADPQPLPPGKFLPK